MATVGVKVLNKTGNRKVGDVAVTMVSQKTCPKTCPFLDAGCYAASGPQGIHTARLNKARASATELARAEAHGIAQLDGTKPMRLHVVGDCSTKTAARTVSKAADAYSAKRGQKVFTYTHAWRNVPREAWGQVSVLASCETPSRSRRRVGAATPRPSWYPNSLRRKPILSKERKLCRAPSRPAGQKPARPAGCVGTMSGSESVR
jgi:hypothetical protein